MEKENYGDKPTKPHLPGNKWLLKQSVCVCQQNTCVLCSNNSVEK